MWWCVRVVTLSALLAFSLPNSIEADAAQQASQPGSVPKCAHLRRQDRALSAPSNVLVRGNTIEKISTDPIPIDNANVTTIDGRGRTLMPGLIDVHWHAMLVRPNPAAALASDVGYLNLLAGAEATATLMRGFTTIRDMGGPTFGLKRAIDEGLLPGPRIYPSGAVITITSGHGDFRQLTDLPRTARHAVAGRADWRAADRRQSGRGPAPRARATHARRIADQAHRRRRRRLAVQPARCRDLYRGRAARRRGSGRELGDLCLTHAYTPVSIQRSIAAGVKCIEHGHLMDEETARLMAEKGIWLSTQPFLADERAAPRSSVRRSRRR